jgi:hypothetical protein
MNVILAGLGLYAGYLLVGMIFHWISKKEYGAGIIPF